MKLRKVEVTNWLTKVKSKALFHGFGLGIDDGASFSLAIVEYKNGALEMVEVEYVRFLDAPEATE